MRIHYSVIFALAIIFVPETSQAEIVLSEDFSGGSTAPLNGTAEDASGVLWQAAAGYGIDGSITGGRSPALLGFQAVNGFVYTASATIDVQGTDIFSMGFAESYDPVRFHNQAGLGGWAFMLTDENGQTSYGRYGNGDRLFDGENEATGNGEVTLDIVMDTTDAIWTASYYVNGNVFTEGVELTGLSEGMINYVGFATVSTSVSGDSKLVNFSLNAVSVPEPSSMAVLAVLSIGGTLTVRRRSKVVEKIG